MNEEDTNNEGRRDEGGRGEGGRGERGRGQRGRGEGGRGEGEERRAGRNEMRERRCKVIIGRGEQGKEQKKRRWKEMKGKV